MAKEVLKKGDKIPFTQIANVVLNEKTLSFKAKGLYAYLYSKDNDYDFAAKRIAKDCSDGVDSVLAGLKELEIGGYLLRNKLKNGRVYYTIHIAKTAKPRLGSDPKRDFPIQGKSLTGKIPSISNIDTETNIDKKTNILYEKRKKLATFQEILNPIFEEKWEESAGDFDKIKKNLRVYLRQGDKVVNRIPTMISDFLDYHHNGWDNKSDYMMTMKNLTKSIMEAEAETVSSSAWNAALERTESMDMATIRTVINAI